jgi:D-alanyl-D-alanine dipeptidase
MRRIFSALLLFARTSLFGQSVELPANDFEWVNLRTFVPSLSFDLRYATPDNVAHRSIYPANTQPMLRAGVARKLLIAQAIVRRSNYRLRIWDAYRPPGAQAELWRLMPKADYIANPETGSGSMHSWGVAVDATLIDQHGRRISMPTDFDDFTPAAMLRYTGNDPAVRSHLYLLQSAMDRAGFHGLRTEWWHFTTSDWKRYVPEERVHLPGSGPSPL